MERKESRNGLELIKYGAIRLKGNFSALFMGALAMVTPLALVFLIPYLISRFTEISWIMSIGVVLFAILVGPMQIGYIKYFNDTIDGKQPKLTLVYSQLKPSIFTLRTIYITLILFILYIVGGILWIVPAGFAVSFYSMTLFFLEKYKYNRLSEAMNDCSRQMIGNRLAMFSYKLIFYFIYLLLFGIGALCLTLVFLLANDSVIVSYFVAVCSTIVFIFMYTMVTVYYHSCNQIFFEDTLMYNERKRAKKLQTTNANNEKQTTTEIKTENDNKNELDNKIELDNKVEKLKDINNTDTNKDNKTKNSSEKAKKEIEKSSDENKKVSKNKSINKVNENSVKNAKSTTKKSSKKAEK